MKKFKKYNVKDIFNMKKNTKIKLGILIFVCFILGISIFAISRGILDEQVEIKSVEIKSDGWDKSEPGSWKVTKSAKWTGLNKAQITMDLETVPKYYEEGIKNFDVVFVLDVSTSMAGAKFDALKSSLKKYLDEILKDNDNHIAFVEYHTTASVLSDFTNNIDDLNDVIDNLELKCKGEVIDGIEQSWGYCTNYADGLAKTSDVLKNYNPSKDRQLTILFLTDGSSNKDNSLIKNRYDDIKTKFPDSVVNGIQYEMGSKINSYLKLGTDEQYDAYIHNIYNKFFVATYKKTLQSYEKLEISDYISDNFYIESETDIETVDGTIEFDPATQKVVWNLDNNFITGSGTRLTINVKVKEPYTEQNGYYPTNSREEILAKFVGQEEILTASKLTPILKNYYTVYYNVNTPENCSLSSINPEIHFVYETVAKRNDKLTCNGYVFRGWQYKDEYFDDVKKVGDNNFIMPEHDVYISAAWGEFNISKSATGTIEEAVCLDFALTGELACLDNLPSPYVTESTGIDFKYYSSDTNGKGLYIYSGTENDEYPIFYYRGAVTNNNLIFADFCWKIVRTTETGGVKLIYNGVPTNGTCNNTGAESQIGTSAFNSSANDVKYVGYMYDTDQSSTMKIFIDNWYENNIENDEKNLHYGEFLEDAIWCNDRNGSKLGTNYLFLGYGVRNLDYKYISKPILTCPLQADNYTTKTGDNSNGNKLLNYPIALLTGDEAQLAGFAWGLDNQKDNKSTYNTTTYLYTGQEFALISPLLFWENNSSYYMTSARKQGYIDEFMVSSIVGVRPSISLKKGIELTTNGTGESGTANNPFIVVES